jgi:hypothetical protein
VDPASAQESNIPVRSLNIFFFMSSPPYAYIFNLLTEQKLQKPPLINTSGMVMPPADDITLYENQSLCNCHPELS